MAEFSLSDRNLETIVDKEPKEVQTRKIVEDISELGDDLVRINQLPSGFKPYENKDIYVRGLKTGEVKTLNKISSPRDLKTLIKIYSKVISGVNVRDLIPIDFKSLMFFVARLTDPDFRLELRTVCAECKKDFMTTLDITDIDYQDLEESNLQAGNFTFYPLTMSDVLFLDQINDSNENKDILDQYDLDLSSLALMSDPSISKNGDMKKFDKQYKLISDLPNNKYTKDLNRVLSSLIIDVNDLPLKCTHCGHQFKSKIILDYSRIYL